MAPINLLRKKTTNAPVSMSLAIMVQVNDLVILPDFPGAK